LQFDVRARVKLFDFGLARELKDADLAFPPDGYQATGLTGSRRYMAPEVALCKHYGFSADLYSYGVLFWESLSGRSAYDGMDYERHFELVVLGGRRPGLRAIPGLPKTLLPLMRQMWDADPTQRGDFSVVCEFLRQESRLLRSDHTPNGHQHHLSDRTEYLMGQSARSQRAGSIE
jgi:serine/threonine protein kinase